jgi:hypothetical protein
MVLTHERGIVSLNRSSRVVRASEASPHIHHTLLPLLIILNTHLLLNKHNTMRLLHSLNSNSHDAADPINPPNL